jgi:Amt family ammonium transporter
LTIFLTVKSLLRVDDTLDLFAEHAIGGIVGLMLNGFFGSRVITGLDGVTTVPGGWIDRNWQQLSIQFGYVFAVCGYTFIMTAIIAKGVDLIPGLHLRSSPEAEKLGTDEVEVWSGPNSVSMHH